MGTFNSQIWDGFSTDYEELSNFVVVVVVVVVVVIVVVVSVVVVD